MKAQWNFSEADIMVGKESHRRCVQAAEVIAEQVRRNCDAFKGGISRPVYKTGKYANKAYTARVPGTLKKSVRVVEREDELGPLLARYGNVRVYVGHYLAYYAQIVEFRTPFMRPAVDSTIAAVRRIMGAG